MRDYCTAERQCSHKAYMILKKDIKTTPILQLHRPDINAKLVNSGARAPLDILTSNFL